MTRVTVIITPFLNAEAYLAVSGEQISVRATGVPTASMILIRVAGALVGASTRPRRA
jgi:hypothetical protein